MKNDFHFLAVKPLSKKTTRAASAEAVILNVMRHNHREIQAEFGTRADSRIDRRRMCDNVTLYGNGTAEGVNLAASAAMRSAGLVATRKNATLGIEIVFSIPAGLAIDCNAYFSDAMQWAQRHFDVPMLSAVVHNDEDYPHAHVVMLPLRDGRLIGSELLGDRTTTKAMQADFHEQVSKHYGLRLPKPQKRHSAAARRAAMQMAFDMLKSNSGLNDDVLRALLEPHSKNPEPLLMALGLTMPPPNFPDSFATIMTRPCKPENPIRTFDNVLVGHSESGSSSTIEPEGQMSYALLGDSFFPTSFAPPAERPTSASGPPPEPAATAANACATTASAADTDLPQVDQPAAHDYDDTDEPGDTYTRERESDHRTDEWDSDKGIWVTAKPAKMSHKAIAVEAVHVALGRIGKGVTAATAVPARRVMRC